MVAAPGPEPLRLIAPDGSAVGDIDALGLSDDELRSLLVSMLHARRLDERCVELQAAGELTVYPPLEGQEAAQVGSAFALGAEDFVFPSFRELAVAIARGVDPVEYLMYHRGTWHGGPYDPIANRFAPVCVPLATQIVHAVGYAMGLKLDRRDACSIAYFGDGAASEGDFHEACNFAAVFDAPVVLFCQNNGWAISVPFEQQAAAPIHLRAVGYGFPGMLVDGNDVLAVVAATREAVARARAGGGPTLIEAMTYRMGPHTTSDDPARYRDAVEVGRRHELDPIERFRRFLLGRGIVDGPWIAASEREAEAFAANVADGVRATPVPPPEDLFSWVFKELPQELVRQRDEALGRLRRVGRPEGGDA